jgi:hypothetical protein
VDAAPSATYDRANEGNRIMRRVLGVVGLIGLGVLLGFVVRLIWPREDVPPVYVPPVTDQVSAERTAA